MASVSRSSSISTLVAHDASMCMTSVGYTHSRLTVLAHAARVALGLKQCDSLTVERDEGLAAEPGALVGDNAIGKIAAGVEHRKSGLRATAIGGNVGGGKQTADGIGDTCGRQAVAAGQNPDELAQSHGRDRDQFRLREFGLGTRALRRVVVGECTDEARALVSAETSSVSRPSPRR